MRKLVNIIVTLLVIGLVGFVFLQFYINNYSSSYITTEIDSLDSAYTGIVLGASVRPDKSLSPILKDRVDGAYQAYKAGKIERFLLSGDHGKKNYDEVNAMKNYLNKLGVPDSVLFLDHAGFDTYDSMWRAKRVFNVDNAIIFTQEFHLPRAVYLARKLGVTAQGYVSDQQDYPYKSSLKRREWLANVKAFTEVVINKAPSYDGPKIPISGDSRLSHDK